MFTIDRRDALVVAHEHVRHLREESAAERLVQPRSLRRSVAASLCRVADRLDAPRLAPRAA